MNFCVTISADEDALIKLFLDSFPGSSVSSESNAELFAAEMMKYKCITTGFIAAKSALLSFVSYCFFFEFLSAPGDIILILAVLAAEPALSP